jgi:phosphopantetheinyl transferase (holo-ACP synthase)
LAFGWSVPSRLILSQRSVTTVLMPANATGPADFTIESTHDASSAGGLRCVSWRRPTLAVAPTRSHSIEPVLRNCDGATLHFGVSSAADSAAVVMSTRFEVAIDIEPVGLALPTDFIENCNVFTPAEQARFATLDHRCRSQLLLRWWTAKEAALKLAGYGLALAPSTIDVSALRATGGRVSFDGRSVALRSVSSAETGYVGSIATSAEPSRVDVIVQD